MLTQQLKFHRRPEAARLMATLMAEALPRPFPENAVVLIPLPLHWRRRLRRGFDQAQLLSLWLHRLTGLPQLPALRRHRATAPQSRLPREARPGNLARAFHATPPPRPGLIPVLVDDVATTGATLSAGRDALLAAGWAPPSIGSSPGPCPQARLDSLARAGCTAAFPPQDPRPWIRPTKRSRRTGS